ncbi:hypothetical protein EDB83DRAFT_2420159 [Lactarius deliciosus]|nr:hypothetical protein EDB83DRAFT_2420159 [Lactarius deliciosus]
MSPPSRPPSSITSSQHQCENAIPNLATKHQHNASATQLWTSSWSQSQSSHLPFPQPIFVVPSNVSLSSQHVTLNGTEVPPTAPAPTTANIAILSSYTARCTAWPSLAVPTTPVKPARDINALTLAHSSTPFMSHSQPLQLTFSYRHRCCLAITGTPRPCCCILALPSSFRHFWTPRPISRPLHCRFVIGGVSHGRSSV